VGVGALVMCLFFSSKLCADVTGNPVALLSEILVSFHSVTYELNTDFGLYVMWHGLEFDQPLSIFVSMEGFQYRNNLSGYHFFNHKYVYALQGRKLKKYNLLFFAPHAFLL
jgi:hypothetical protein